MNEPEYYEFHKACAKYFNPKLALEIGYGEGVSTEAFLEGCDGMLFSIDIEPKNHLIHDRLEFIQGSSPQVFTKLSLPPLDYIYIDGDKRSMHVYWDAYASCKLLKRGGVIFFDDCDNSWAEYVNRGIEKFREDVYVKEFFPNIGKLNPHGSRFFTL